MSSNKIRVVLANSHNPSDQRTIELDRSSLEINALLQIGSRELKIRNATKLYLDNGDELTSRNQISNGDTIHVSDGGTLENPHEVIHLCMLGAGAVGKSALTLQFIQGQFVADYDPTIEDAYRKHVSVDGNPLLLDVLDTAGQEDFVALRTSWMRNRDGFILTFSIVERKSFEELQSFYDQLMEVYEENIPPFVLVGNKCDLDPNLNINLNSNELSSQSKYERRVSFDEATDKARRWNATRYIETSAKTGYHVQDMFGGLVREIIAQQYATQAKPPAKKPSIWDKICQIL